MAAVVVGLAVAIDLAAQEVAPVFAPELELG
jgi:hypothetical protein